MSNLTLAKYLCTKMKSWTIFPFLKKLMHLECSMLICYIKTKPCNDEKYDSKDDITMCLVTPMIAHYGVSQNDIFLLCTTHVFGIYKQALKSRAYNINHFTPCIVGSNRIKIGDTMHYRIDKTCPEADYIEIDWCTGMPTKNSSTKHKKLIRELLAEHKLISDDVRKDSKKYKTLINYAESVNKKDYKSVDSSKDLTNKMHSESNEASPILLLSDEYLTVYNLIDELGNKILSIIRDDELFVNYMN